MILKAASGNSMKNENMIAKEGKYNKSKHKY